MKNDMLKLFVYDLSNYDTSPLERVRTSLAAGMTVEAYLAHAAQFLSKHEYPATDYYYIGDYDAYYALCFKRNASLYTFANS